MQNKQLNNWTKMYDRHSVTSNCHAKFVWNAICSFLFIFSNRIYVLKKAVYNLKKGCKIFDAI